MDEDSSSSEIEHDLKDSGNRRRTKKTRTALACTRCRQRRTKCSGRPAPCDICRKDGEYCHFHPRLDSRRKDGLSSTDVATRRKSILHGLLLAIRSNSDQDVKNLVKVLRSSDASPLDMAKFLNQQLCTALSRSRDTLPPPTEDDLLSLVLLEMLSHHKQSMRNMSDRNVQQQSAEALAVDEDKSMSSSNQTVDSLTTNDYSLLGSEIPYYDDSGFEKGNVGLPPDYTAILQHQPIAMPLLVASQVYPFSTNVWTSPDTKAAVPTLKTDSRFSKAVESRAMPTITNDGVGAFAPIQWSPNTFDHLFSIPESDFSRLCMGLRDTGRQMLAQGVSLSDLIGGKRLNCDLLFRDRILGEQMNISDRCCEIARRLPPLPPATRIALALCFSRMMPYIILPCQQTWQSLPEALRSTEFQYHTPHDITVDFLPIPALRNLLSHRYADWLIFASQYNLTLDWPGIWGDVQGAPLTEAGNWHQNYQPLRLRKNIDFSLQIKPECRNSRPSHSEVKAIRIDPASGQKYVSQEFERQCWNPDNWRFDEGVTEVWPDVSDYPSYLQGDSLRGPLCVF